MALTTDTELGGTCDRGGCAAAPVARLGLELKPGR